MSATLRLFENWKIVKGLTSDREACRTLGLSHSAANHWRRGQNGDPDVLERMCKDLGRDVLPVMLDAYAETTRSAPARRAIERVAKRFAALVVVLAVTLGAYVGQATPALAGVKAPAGIFIMRTWLRRLMMRDALEGACAPFESRNTSCNQQPRRVSEFLA